MHSNDVLGAADYGISLSAEWSANGGSAVEDGMTAGVMVGSHP